MGPLTRAGLTLALLALMACSPEATRTRDGGPGADIGNARRVTSPPVNPEAADTTLWPARARPPVDRLAGGTMQLPK
jgi:hypothetical protein